MKKLKIWEKFLSPFELQFQEDCPFESGAVIAFDGETELIVLQPFSAGRLSVVILNDYKHTGFLLKYNKFLNI